MNNENDHDYDPYGGEEWSPNEESSEPMKECFKNGQKVNKILNESPFQRVFRPMMK